MFCDTDCMMQEPDKKSIRQFAYRERAIRAKTYARVLMPVAVFAVGASVWKDPDLGPQMTETFQEIRPVAASYLVNTPFEDMLGPLPEPERTQAQAEPADAEQVTASFDLPEDTVPVNRP